MTNELTAFQRLLPDDESNVQELLEDLRDLENITPEGESVDDLEGWEMSLTFTEEDVPKMIEEIEEVTD
jgi:hypothetical protein